MKLFLFLSKKKNRMLKIDELIIHHNHYHPLIFNVKYNALQKRKNVDLFTYNFSLFLMILGFFSGSV